MTIGELARAADCTTETVRYYEKQGLLPGPTAAATTTAPTAQAYRAASLRAKLPRPRPLAGRNCGLLALMQRPAADCESVNAVLDVHIADVEGRLRELRSLRDQLLTLRKECQSKSTVGRCRILRGISHLGENGTPHAS